MARHIKDDERYTPQSFQFHYHSKPFHALQVCMILNITIIAAATALSSVTIVIEWCHYLALLS